MIALYIIVWVVCGVFGFGFTFGHFQRKYPRIASDNYDSDKSFAFCIAVLGPIGLFATAIMSGLFPYGLKFK